MKKTIVALLLVSTMWAPLLFPGQEVIEEIVAIVNDEIITLSQARQQYDLMLQQLRAEQLPPEQYDQQREAIRKGLLEEMIMGILLLQKAKELDINVSEQLRSVIENIKKENNMASDADLRKALQQQGVSYEAWYKQYEEALLRQAVLFSEVERSIVLDDAEVVQYYKQHPDEFRIPVEFKLRAVYFSQEGKNPADLEALKNTVSENLKNGEDFAAVAGRYSDPPLNETQGDLGRLKKGELDKTLEEAAEKLKPGETSPWIEARNGWYLIKLEEKSESFLQPFEEIKEAVQEKLFLEIRESKLGEYFKKIRTESFVRILKPEPWGY